MGMILPSESLQFKVADYLEMRKLRLRVLARP